MRIARLHARIANIRRNALHHLTAFLSANYSEVVIEDLNVRGMMANHKLARAIADIGFYEFRRQLDYKMALRGGIVIVADRFFPSSKLLPLLRLQTRATEAFGSRAGVSVLQENHLVARSERGVEPSSLHGNEMGRRVDLG